MASTSYSSQHSDAQTAGGSEEVIATEQALIGVLGKRPKVETGAGLNQVSRILRRSAFWRRHAESFLRRQPYSEAAAQLVCMAYLHLIVNGGGFIDREYAVGSGRIALCARVASGSVGF